MTQRKTPSREAPTPAKPTAPIMVSEKKSRWLAALESKLGTTLLSVLGGGIAVTVVAGFIQANARESELDRLHHQQYIQQRLVTVETALETIGDVVSCSQSLIYLTDSDWNPENFVGEEAQERYTQERESIRADRNRAFLVWRRKRESLGVLLSYYHGGSKTIRESWAQIADAVDSFAECSKKWHDKNRSPTDTSNACTAERETVREALDKFAQDLDAASEYSWVRKK